MKTLTIASILLIMAAEIALVYMLREKFNVKEKPHSFDKACSMTEVSLNSSNQVAVTRNGKVLFSVNGRQLFMDRIDLSGNDELVNDKKFITNADITLNEDESSITIHFAKNFPSKLNRISALSPHLNILSNNYILLDERFAKELGYYAIKINPRSFRIIESKRRGLVVTAQYNAIRKMNV